MQCFSEKTFIGLIMNSFPLLRELSAAMLLSLLSLLAHAQANASTSSANIVRYQGDNTVSSCSPDRHGDFACETLTMPSSVGDVVKLVDGDFVKAARASWIAMGPLRFSLCAQFQTNEVRCQVIGQPNFSGVAISHGLIGVKNVVRFSAVETADLGRPYLETVSRQFMEKFAIAKWKLEHPGEVPKGKTVKVGNTVLKVGSNGDISTMSCGVDSGDPMPCDDMPIVEIPPPRDSGFPGGSIDYPIGGGGDENLPSPAEYDACVALICEPADAKFVARCYQEPSPVEQAKCMAVATNLYSACLTSCRTGIW